MNIYTILMSKDKCETFFPKLNHTRQPTRNAQKKKNTTANPIRKLNHSIDETKYRMTCHDILKNYTPQVKLESEKKISQEPHMRTTFLRHIEPKHNC